MPEDQKPADTISPEIQEVTRNLVNAFRAVKLYPSNNPIYAQSVHKAFESLDLFLQTTPHFAMGVQKTYFLFEDVPVAKEAQVNRGIAQDLFAKGIREIVFLAGVAEEELLELCKALALLPEELAMRSGIVSILWEKSATHIKVTEASLEEVITTPGEGRKVYGEEDEAPQQVNAAVANKELHFKGRTIVLGEMLEDPKAFGSKMLEIAHQTKEEGQSVEDRLHEIYQETGRNIGQESAEDQDELFKGLARSVLEMEEQYRDKFISSKLYAHIDGEHLRQQQQGEDKHLPEELHEIVTGRFSKEWSVKQIATLLKKSSLEKPEAKLPPILPSALEAVPISDETLAVARELTEYTPAEMDALRAISEVGTESDIIEAAVRTLIFLIPLVKSDHHTEADEKERALFSGVIHQLETILTYLLKNKEYDLATIIVRSFHLPVHKQFEPRLDEAIKKASSRDVITAVVTDMRMSKKASPEYLASYAYLTVLDQQATAVLLEALAAEKDRAIRRYLLDILKELGRNQIAKIGKRITDSRWYVVRNVVHILAESKNEEAIGYLEKVVDHKQTQIRHEVIKGLTTIGGKKAATLLLRLLQDNDLDIQLQAVRALGTIVGAGPDVPRTIEALLEKRPVKRKDHELSQEAIRTLGRTGDAATIGFLARYNKLRWWRSKQLQEELRAAASASIDQIQRRQGNG